MKKIKLNTIKGKDSKYALVDNEDYEWLNKYTWSNNRNYARRNTWHRVNGKVVFLKNICMHRAIMEHYKFEIPENKEIDHINNNPLDNRKRNLRIVSPSLNNLNKDNKNVFYMKAGRRLKRWQPRLRVNGKYIFFGYFLTFEEAFKVAQEAKLQYLQEGRIA